MDFTAREYQMYKTKHSLKAHKICFFSQNITERAPDWIATEQKVDSLDFNYYKMNTRAAHKVIRGSKHLLKSSLIACTTALLFRKRNFKTYKKVSFDRIATEFVLLAVKVNNIIYSTKQLKNLLIFYYRIMLLGVHKLILANIKKRSNNIEIV
jgi:hypothetical protein